MRTLFAVAAATLVATSAQAARDLSLTPLVGNHWSVATGETVSPGRDALSFELGWPGIGIGYLHGLSDRSDVGIKFDLLYGYEARTDSKVGFGLTVPLRLVANRKDRVSIALNIDPGVRLYAGNAVTNNTDFYLRFPVGATLGLQATPEVRIAAKAVLNMALRPTQPFPGFEVGPQFGFAAEYAVDKELLVGLNTLFGPSFDTGFNDGASFGFVTQVVIGYRL